MRLESLPDLVFKYHKWNLLVNGSGCKNDNSFSIANDMDGGYFYGGCITFLGSARLQEKPVVDIPYCGRAWAGYLFDDYEIEDPFERVRHKNTIGELGSMRQYLP